MTTEYHYFWKNYLNHWFLNHWKTLCRERSWQTTLNRGFDDLITPNLSFSAKASWTAEQRLLRHQTSWWQWKTGWHERSIELLRWKRWWDEWSSESLRGHRRCIKGRSRQIACRNCQITTFNNLRRRWLFWNTYFDIKLEQWWCKKVYPIGVRSK